MGEYKSAPVYNLMHFACSAYGYFRKMQEERGHHYPTWDQLKPGQQLEWVDALNHCDLTISPQRAHQIWCGKKLQLGWRFGLEHDEAEKTSPYLLPYELLPEHVREKDEAVIKAVKLMNELRSGAFHARLAS